MHWSSYSSAPISCKFTSPRSCCMSLLRSSAFLHGELESLTDLTCTVWGVKVAVILSAIQSRAAFRSLRCLPRARLIPNIVTCGEGSKLSCVSLQAFLPTEYIAIRSMLPLKFCFLFFHSCTVFFSMNKLLFPCNWHNSIIIIIWTRYSDVYTTSSSFWASHFWIH